MDMNQCLSFPYRHIVVVGVTACGKSTLAEELARRLDLEYIELDAIFWKPGWVESRSEEFRERVEAVTRAPRWALAGNYSKVRDIVWPRADAVIWLDYPFLLVFKRLWDRTWRRWRTRELLWNTNYETLLPQFKIWSKESLFYWQVYSYGRHKRLYPQLFASPEYSHLKLFQFKHPREMEAWVTTL
jgi:shikimate kinase